ncbi:MAG: diaminopimelate epimerase [Bacteroidia bacterium]
MKHNFWKYHGTGNDFILINNCDQMLSHSPEFALKLCDRHFGIGSDGLIIIEKSIDADFKMIFYNPDGSKSFCGNGSRCAVRFAMDQGIIDKNKTSLDSTDGKHLAEINGDIINLKMHQPQILDLNFSQKELPLINKAFVNTGSPHLILFIDPKLNILEIDVRQKGAEIRYSSQFKKEGININFVGVDGENDISIRTYERGVEDETLSCGTGVTAAAIAYHSLFNKNSGSHCIDVNAVGGQLKVKFDFKDNTYSNTWLCGPAELVYSGGIEV